MIVLGDYKNFTLVVNRSNTDPKQVTYHLFRPDGWNEATSRECSIHLGNVPENHIFAEAKRRYDEMGRPDVDFWDGDKLEALGIWHGPTPLFSTKIYQNYDTVWTLQVTVCKQVWERKFPPGCYSIEDRKSYWLTEEIAKGQALFWREEFKLNGALHVINEFNHRKDWKKV